MAHSPTLLANHFLPAPDASLPPALAALLKQAQSADAVEQAAAPDSGVFLAPDDLEELFALVRKGSKLRIVR